MVEGDAQFNPPDESRARVGIVGYNLLRDSGESRQMVNFAVGLKALGYSPTIFCLAASSEVSTRLSRIGVDLVAEKETLTSWDLFSLMSHSHRLSRALARLIRGSSECATYVVAQDAAIPIVNEELSGRLIYYSCGDMTLLLLDKRFRKVYGLVPELLSARFVAQMERHAAMARQFDIIISNSEFTRSLMSYLYDCPIQGVVYPPVDTSTFRPSGMNPDTPPHALAILRGPAEPAYEVVRQVAERLEVRVVGRTPVLGAVSLGRISDAELVVEYARAVTTISPSFRELFGYPIAESLACGTPSIAFDHGGAREIIKNGRTGWLVKSGAEFIDKVQEVAQSPPSEAVRAECRASADRFSIANSSVALAGYMNS